MERRLRNLMRLPLFEGVSPSLGAIQATHLFLRVPAYRRVFQTWNDFRAGVADILGDFNNVPLHRTYDLYELWAFLRLARGAALQSGSQGSWRASFVEREALGGLVVRPEGKAFRFDRFELVFQPLFTETWRRSGPSVGSFSRAMQPDIALIGPGAGETPVPVLVLDAKYRVDGGLSDAVSSIHMYCDALVQDAGAQGGTKRVVRAAFLLTPAELTTEKHADWRDETTPGVFLREGYRERYRFGAVALRPGISVEQCRELITSLLALAQEAKSNS